MAKMENLAVDDPIWGEGRGLENVYSIRYFTLKLRESLRCVRVLACLLACLFLLRKCILLNIFVRALTYAYAITLIRVDMDKKYDRRRDR